MVNGREGVANGKQVVSVKESAAKYLDTHHADGGPYNSEDIRKAYDAGAAEERKRSAGLLRALKEIAHVGSYPEVATYEVLWIKAMARADAAIAEFEKGSANG